MIKKRYLVALGALAAATTACGSDINHSGASGGSSGSAGSNGMVNGKGGSSGNVGTGGSGTGGSGTGGSGTGGSGTGGSGTGGASGNGGSGNNAGAGGDPTCSPGIPNTSQVPRMLNRQYDAAVRDLLGVTTLGSQGEPPSAQLVPDFDGPMIADAWRLYQDVGNQIATAVISGANKTKFINCVATDAACQDTTIRSFGRQAFRRPMTDAEVTSFQQKLAQVTPAGTADQIAQAILYTFLVSPSFLLIPELDNTVQASGGYQLNHYEVAARLSFLLWGSVPDKELNDAADNKMLGTKQQILDQATRMLAVKEKAGPMIAMFHRVNFAGDNGATTSHWWKVSHDGNALYDSNLKATYRQEMDMFFEDVAFSGGSFKDLFLSPVAFVNAATAPIYDYPTAGLGTELTRVELDPNTRPGFLTRVGFLSSFAHGDSTSPILRGAYITVNMIGVNPGAPNTDNLTKTVDGTFATERAYVEALTSSQDACKGCHIPYVNPPGLALENFDSIGKWQTTDKRGGAIDMTNITVTFAEGDERPVATPLDLMKGIGETAKAKHMYSEKWVSFATGRQPNANDACAVADFDMKLSTDGYGVLDLLTDLTQLDSFSVRTRATP